MIQLWKPKIIDNSLVWLSHKEKFKKWSWQFDYTAVTNHWQFSCMAVCLKISLTTLLHSFENRWQWSYTALISLTNVLYGCHKSLTNVQNGHEPQSWQNLKYYFQRHVCLSIRPSVRSSVRPSVRRLAPIPAGKSQDVTNKSCSICLRDDPWGPWRSRT